MRLEGVLELNVPPSRVLQSLGDPDVIQAFLPGECTVTPTGAGTYDFALRKSLGFLELRLGGQITVEDQGPDQARMTMKASHKIGGALDMDMGLTLTPQGTGTQIAYSGTLDATGLAGRVVRDRALQIRPYVTKVFDRLKARIESEPAA
jgi:carbon monoxide dehydrogenase subunit G